MQSIVDRLTRMASLTYQTCSFEKPSATLSPIAPHPAKVAKYEVIMYQFGSVQKWARNLSISVACRGDLIEP